ncbi:MAG: Rod shape-determining protein mreC [Verrucomicrobiota bacterium]|jgi:rod shape-determining protein MreC
MLLKKPQLIALGVVLLVTIVLLRLPSRAAANLKLAVAGFFLPAYGVAETTADAANAATYNLLPRHSLVGRIVELERLLQETELQRMQANEVLQENARLRAQMDLPRQHRWRLKPARVISRDPANWWRTLHINVGSRDGITNDLPVLTAQGLVGRITEVGLAQSQVVLVGDPGCPVSVLISETREQGMIAPLSSSPLDDTLVELSYLSRNSKLAPGQQVVTSGLGRFFPPGIVVGQVADVRTAGYGLYKEARVSLAVKLNSLEEVWVKLP